MMRAYVKTTLVFILILVLTLTTAGVVVAQGEDGDGDGDGEGRPFEHPVVALLESYFGIEAGQVATLRQEEGIGLGVLVKLYAIAAESGVPVEELIKDFKAGTGLGQLFKQYGKPAVLGVGHIRGDDQGGPPPHAGPKENAGEDDEGGGPPPHAGPKDGHDQGPPPHAGPKENAGEDGE